MHKFQMKGDIWMANCEKETRGCISIPVSVLESETQSVIYNPLLPHPSDPLKQVHAPYDELLGEIRGYGPEW